MAKENESKKFEDFILAMSELNKIVELGEARKDTRSEFIEKSKKDYIDYAYDSAVKQGLIDPTARKREQYSDEKEAQGHLSLAAGLISRNASDGLQNNLENILAETPEPTLGKMINIEKVSEATDPKDADVVNAYRVVQILKEFEEKYEGNQKLDENGQKTIMDSAAKGFGDEMAAKFKGYDSDLQEQARALASVSVQTKSIAESKIRGYALAGLKARIDESQKAYEDIAKEKKKDVYSITRDAVRKLAKGTREEFETAKSILYQAHTGKLGRAE